MGINKRDIYEIKLLLTEIDLRIMKINKILRECEL